MVASPLQMSVLQYHHLRYDLRSLDMGRQQIVFLQIEPEFVAGFTKKIIDSRKKVVEGISKGISKIVSTYA